MKFFTRSMLGIVALWLAGALTLAAQETPAAAKATVIRKTIQEDGNIKMEKKEIKETELAKYLEELTTTTGEKVEIHLSTVEGENIRISPNDDGTLLYFREANSKAFGLTKISESNGASFNENTVTHSKTHNPDGTYTYKKVSVYPATAAAPAAHAFSATSNTGRPILGIYADESSDQKGIVIGSLSSSKGVAAAGLKSGDVITVVDGKNLSNSADLRNALASHKPGDKVTVTYLRDGQPVQAEVTLAGEGSSSVRVNAQPDPCRVFIGVGTSIRSGEGLHVDYIVENTPAQVSDVRGGDVILALDNVQVSTQSELELERDKHQPGETFELQILRAGQPMTINARFKECSQEDRQRMEEERARRQTERQEWVSFMRESRQTEVERDPCQVFIGIYTHSLPGGGRQVDGIIKGTPAESSNLQKGDVILALDDVKVNSHTEIIRERNKHQPGDRFTLSILRNGEYLEVDAQFKACGEQPTEEEIPTQLAESLQETETPTVLPLVEPDRTLKVEEWNAYPNPTFGRVNLQFRAESVPTSLQIIDAAGKTVYEENLNRFDGFYQKQLDLKDNMPGVYILVVRQGDKVFYNKVVLLAKA